MGVRWQPELLVLVLVWCVRATAACQLRLAATCAGLHSAAAKHCMGCQRDPAEHTRTAMSNHPLHTPRPAAEGLLQQRLKLLRSPADPT
jgi:hypothetical protein